MSSLFAALLRPGWRGYCFESTIFLDESSREEPWTRWRDLVCAVVSGILELAWTVPPRVFWTTDCITSVDCHSVVVNEITASPEAVTNRLYLQSTVPYLEAIASTEGPFVALPGPASLSQCLLTGG